MLRTCHEWISKLAAESVHWSEVSYSHRQHVGNESCRGPAIRSHNTVALEQVSGCDINT